MPEHVAPSGPIGPGLPDANAAGAADRPGRGVVSFVRRGSRMNASQQRAMDDLAPRYLIDVPRADMSTSVAPGAWIDLAERFGREAPLAVEIGSGTGDSLVAMAGARPEMNVLAFEVYAPAVASTMGRLDRAGVRNVRLIAADGAEGLRELVGTARLTELWTLFPDPWPKKRHRKRRLIAPAFAGLVADRLADGGLWRLATDWTDYAEQMAEVLGASGLFINQYADRPGGWAPRGTRPLTRFERRGLSTGRAIRDLVWTRAPR
ncbi:tRNA (guanosine(46)-N7)-methyltransferase TrmB [uncultured Propionibacterium sp.]|uniref:tRNA (guanosine(46)-N7)-methyltransferase TrmB n=1 Tax=uncultured Propionibacterium sp. TaxID=218066 RepID=UPI0029303EEF|nr:tRNA (guanosine(46)-N7)-methyltransferase TrmB [uncultured Propionibacterium sp.]